MPCSECGSRLVIIEDYPTCPSCERIGIVPKPDAVRIMQSILDEGKQNLLSAIAAYEPDHIIETAFVLRELAARNFTLHYTALDLEMLIGSTTMIKMLLQTPRSTAGRRASTGEAMRLIKSYAILLSAEDNLHSLRAGTHSMIHTTRYRLDRLGGLRPADFPLYPNEDFAPVMSALRKHGIMTEAEAVEKVEKMRKELKRVELGSKKIATLEQTISTFYRASSMLRVAFTANRMRKEIFSLPDGEDTPATFFELKGLIAGIPAFDGGVTWCPARRFELYVKSRLGGRYAAFARNFVAGSGNPGAFPLFLKIGDKVFVSHFFGELHCYALLPVLHKRAFDRKRMDRGKSYERKVQAHFEGLGFRYIPNVKRRFKHTLNVKREFEIDGIAVSGATAYVIEAKCWASRQMIGDSAHSYYLAEKIRGAIDGMQHEHAAQKTKRVGVALSSKVDWVRENREQFGIGENAAVKGLLVVNTPPPVSEYHGCRVEFLDDFGMGCL